MIQKYSFSFIYIIGGIFLYYELTPTTTPGSYAKIQLQNKILVTDWHQTKVEKGNPYILRQKFRTLTRLSENCRSLPVLRTMFWALICPVPSFDKKTRTPTVLRTTIQHLLVPRTSSYPAISYGDVDGYEIRTRTPEYDSHPLCARWPRELSC